MMVIDNDYLQLQVRTRPGKGPNFWSGVTQVGARWGDKTKRNILFLFGGSKFDDLNNSTENSEIVDYKVKPHANYTGLKIHEFHIKKPIEADNNYIKIEELPLGLYNVQTVGSSLTFKGSLGFVGSWDNWNSLPRVVLRNRTLYEGNSAAEVAKSWRLKDSENFLNEPSDICRRTPTCGPNITVECF
jgi:hypothetical protein